VRGKYLRTLQAHHRQLLLGVQAADRAVAELTAVVEPHPREVPEAFGNEQPPARQATKTLPPGELALEVPPAVEHDVTPQHVGRRHQALAAQWVVERRLNGRGRVFDRGIGIVAAQLFDHRRVRYADQVRFTGQPGEMPTVAGRLA